MPVLLWILVVIVVMIASIMVVMRRRSTNSWTAPTADQVRGQHGAVEGQALNNAAQQSHPF